VYPFVDLLLAAGVSGDAAAEALDDVESVHWLDPRTVDLDELAFPSMRKAVICYRAERKP
jgi:hypothetical protein